MSLKEDVIDMKKEVNDIKEKSFAMELLSDARKTNKRMFIIILVLIACLMGSIGYTIYLLNDIGEFEETTITQENENGYNNYIGNDGDITYGETSNQEE